MTACLCGIVTLQPRNPSADRPRRASIRFSGWTGSSTVAALDAVPGQPVIVEDRGTRMVHGPADDTGRPKRADCVMAAIWSALVRDPRLRSTRPQMGFARARPPWPHAESRNSFRGARSRWGFFTAQALDRLSIVGHVAPANRGGGRHGQGAAGHRRLARASAPRSAGWALATATTSRSTMPDAPTRPRRWRPTCARPVAGRSRSRPISATRHAVAAMFDRCAAEARRRSTHSSAMPGSSTRRHRWPTYPWPRSAASSTST